MNATVKYLAALAVIATLTACASRPPPAPPLPQPQSPPPPVAQPAAPPVVAQPVAPIGPAPGSVAHFQAVAGDRVYFALDSWELSADAQAGLQRQAQWLRTYPGVTVQIAGNCDERGTREYNLALGAKRASAARDYLVANGVAAGRISTISYGKERPLDARSTEEAWSVNRNATTIVVSGATS